MKIQHEDYEQITVISMKGDMIAEELEPFKRLCNDHLSESTRDFVLDMSNVGFIDSRGLEMLMWLQDAAGENLGQIRLVGLDENMTTILRITRSDTRFDLYEDINTALKSLR